MAKMASISAPVILPKGFVVPSISPVQKTINSKTSKRYLDQLCTNALPSYVPSQPDFKGDATCEIHCCCDCGDIFVSRSSLLFHTLRRSVLIKLKCDTCPSVQIFYNRCNLLAHIRTHTEKSEPSSVKEAIVSPLPRVLMDGLHLDIMKSIEAEEANAENSLTKKDKSPDSSTTEVTANGYKEDKTTPVLKNNQHQNNFKNSVAISSSTPLSTTSMKGQLRCVECGKFFATREERKAHFSGNDKVPCTISLCHKCSILCPTECSLKAHKRLHLQIGPYVCPECGDDQNRNWDVFQKHMKYKCFHYTRSVGYKCPLCDTFTHSLKALREHVVRFHTDNLYKCRGCPTAFKTLLAFFSHKKRNHFSEDVGHEPIFKCGICDIVFLGKDLTESHIDSHVKDIQYQYIFTCVICSKAVMSLSSIRDHVKQEHPKFYEQWLLPYEKESNDSDNELNDSQLLSENRVECLLCNSTFQTLQGYSLHLMRSHTHRNYPCGTCGNSLPNRIQMIAHGKEHLKKGMFLCLLCHNKQINDSDTLDMHLLYHVERLKFCTRCPVCECPLSTFKRVMSHLKEEHEIKVPKAKPEKSNRTNVKGKTDNNADAKTNKQPVSKEMFENVGTSTSLPMVVSVTSKNAPNSDGPKKSPLKKEKSPCNDVKVISLARDANRKSVEKSSTKITEVTISDTKNPKDESISHSTGSDGIPKAKQPKLGERCCGKCHFRSCDKTEFKAHILTHKDIKSSFQCQECGLSFVVEPSLRKHLKILHRIMDADRYITEEGTNYMPEADAQPEAAKANDLECTVCFETFASDALLKTHMRSHGMAFIQAKKVSVT